MNLKSITDEFSALMYEYPFRVPAYYALIIRSLVTLDGIAITVDPDFKVLSKAYPYVAKRLLSDPAPQLRSSLQDLLFQDGSFRWNRLENLLKNAKSSEEYDLNTVIDQTIGYLFSDRGEFLRVRIADELAKELDKAGYGLLQRVTQALRLTEDSQPSIGYSEPVTTSSWEQFARILGIIRNTPGLNAATITSILPKLIAQPEARDIGRRVVNGVAQRAIARIIREVLVTAPEPRSAPTPATSVVALPPVKAA